VLIKEGSGCLSTPAGFGDPHHSEGRSHRTQPSLAVLFAATQPLCLGEKGAERVPFRRAAMPLGHPSVGSSRPRAPCSCAATACVAARSDCSVLASLHPPYLLLNIYHAVGLLSSTQLPARQSHEGETRSRSAWAERGEKMALAGVVLLSRMLTSLRLWCPLRWQACGRPLQHGWAGEQCSWFVQLGEVLAT